MPRPRLLLLLAAALSLGAGHAAEPAWPHYRGPGRDGISRETGLFAVLDKNGPKQSWKAAIGTGFSSITVADGLAYASGNRDDTDTIYCFDALTGQEVWRHTYPCKPDPNQFEGGPTATPTVAGGAVYTLSRDGQVFRLDARTGKPAWSKNLAKEIGVGKPDWGFSGSALVDGGRVVFNVVAGGVALDQVSGTVLWKSGSGRAGNSTPLPFTAGGSPLLLVFAENSLLAVDPATGKPAWSHPWKSSSGVNSVDPSVVGDDILVSSGLACGCALLSVAGGAPKELWQHKSAMRSLFSNCVVYDGCVYGFDYDGMLRCLDVKTGSERWLQNGFGKGTLIIADGKLVILSEKGELAIADAASAAYHELCRSQVLSGKCWTMPALCAGRIYCRNAKGDLVCLATE